MRFALLWLAFIFVLGCQTPAHLDWAKVHAGLDKDQVLELMGNPVRTERIKGKDRWTFVFYENQIRREKEVHFLEGIAVYTGDHIEPAVAQQASQIDARRLEKAKEEELEDQKAAEQERVRKQSLGGLDSLRPEDSPTHTQSPKSKSPPPKPTPVRYAPEFEPL